MCRRHSKKICHPMDSPSNTTTKDTANPKANNKIPTTQPHTYGYKHPKPFQHIGGQNRDTTTASSNYSNNTTNNTYYKKPYTSKHQKNKWNYTLRK